MFLLGVVIMTEIQIESGFTTPVKEMKIFIPQKPCKKRKSCRAPFFEDCVESAFDFTYAVDLDTGEVLFPMIQHPKKKARNLMLDFIKKDVADIVNISDELKKTQI